MTPTPVTTVELTEDGWHTGEMGEESNSEIEENRSDIDLALVEEACFQREQQRDGRSRHDQP